MSQTSIIIISQFCKVRRLDHQWKTELNRWCDNDNGNTFMSVSVSWLMGLGDGLFKYLLKTKPFSRDRYPTICLNCIVKMARNLCKEIFLTRRNLFVETLAFHYTPYFFSSFLSRTLWWHLQVAWLKNCHHHQNLNMSRRFVSSEMFLRPIKINRVWWQRN